uniref:cytochrome c oxidase subunit III n=1 Tax=Chuniphyes multidentata TaxID=316200 RepID=UPI0026E3EB9E|nr:cytochrome c oxidase subunit III [Chuniphyes multidentata]WJJ69912.1 cytochrome c oxidase subunit 3 [Chuniphyes multidentata]
MNRITSPYHTVSPSPWPFFMAIATFCTAYGLIFYFWKHVIYLLIVGLLMMLGLFFIWCRDIIREATFQGAHSLRVVAMLKLGFILFVASEIMLFVSFFWGFFHSSLSPSIEIGSIWPPIGISPISPLGLPLFNTAILLTSGASITWSHHALVAGKKSQALMACNITYLLGILFTLIQLYEYKEASFSIAEGIYGTTFYMLTGFHGGHVIIGTLFIIVGYYRMRANHFTSTRHVGFECAIWYWHFVDVVWILLYLTVYCWGSL